MKNLIRKILKEETSNFKFEMGAFKISMLGIEKFIDEYLEIWG